MNEFVIKNGFISQGTSYVSDGNLGVGVTSPTSRLEVKGVDTSSSNYGLKVQNSGGTDNLLVRNDSTVVIGDSSEYQGGSFYYTRNNGYDNKFYMNPNLGNGTNSLNYFDLNVGWIRQGQNNGSGFGLTTVKNELTIFDDFGVLRLNKDTYNGYTGYNNLEVSFREGTGSFGSGSMGSFAYNRTLSFNDIYDREIRGIKIDTSLGTFSNSGSGVSTNIGLDVKVGNGDINYSALFNGGNVGIGATSPSSKLHIIGYDSTSSNYGLKVQNSGGTDNLVVRNDGNVGIGVPSTPNYKLEVIGNNNTTITLIGDLSTSIATAVISSRALYGTTSNHDLGLLSNGTERLTLLNTGNVGIGTSTPTSQLDINGTNGYNQLRLRTSYTPSGSTDINGNIGDVGWDDNYFYWKTSTQWLRISGQTW